MGVLKTSFLAPSLPGATPGEIAKYVTEISDLIRKLRRANLDVSAEVSGKFADPTGRLFEEVMDYRT